MTDEYISLALRYSRTKTPNFSKAEKNFLLAIDGLKAKVAEQEAEIASLKKASKPAAKKAPAKKAPAKKKATKKASAK